MTLCIHGFELTPLTCASCQGLVVLGKTPPGVSGNMAYFTSLAVDYEQARMPHMEKYDAVDFGLYEDAFHL